MWGWVVTSCSLTPGCSAASRRLADLRGGAIHIHHLRGHSYRPMQPHSLLLATASPLAQLHSTAQHSTAQHSTACHGTDTAQQSVVQLPVWLDQGEVLLPAPVSKVVECNRVRRPGGRVAAGSGGGGQVVRAPRIPALHKPAALAKHAFAGVILLLVAVAPPNPAGCRLPVHGHGSALGV